LIVPQVTEVDTSVKIPTAGPEVMTNAPPAVQAAPAAKGGAAPATAAAPAAAVASKKGPPAKVVAPSVPGGGAKVSKVDIALALVAAIVAIAGLVDLFLQS
jgi:hypothetical protein